MFCKKCKSIEELHLHHIDYTFGNIAYLCPNCHGKITSINTLIPKMIGGYMNDEKGKIKIRNLLFNKFLFYDGKLNTKSERKNFIKKFIPWKVVGKLGRSRENDGYDLH